MPPKEATSDAGRDPLAMVLLQIMAENGFEIKPASSYVLLGLSSPKNVGRKLNDLAKPYGFVYKAGKFTKDDAAVAAPATPATTTDGAADNNDASTAAEPPKKKFKTSKTSKTPKSAANATPKNYS